MLGSTNSDYVTDPWTSVLSGVYHAVCTILQYWLEFGGVPGGMLPSMTQQSFMPPHVSAGLEVQASPLLAALQEVDRVLQQIHSEQQQQQQQEEQHCEVGLSTCQEVLSAACAAAEAAYLLLCIKLARDSQHQQGGQGM
jgi:hypothetical protein